MMRLTQMRRAAASRRGAFYTIDAIIATLLLALGVPLVLSTLQGVDVAPLAESTIALRGFDALAVLEKNHTLLDAANTNVTSRLQLYVDMLPANQCGNITLHNASVAPLASVQTSGCVYTGEETSAVVRRSYIYNDKFYIAAMRLWYR